MHWRLFTICAASPKWCKFLCVCTSCPQSFHRLVFTCNLLTLLATDPPASRPEWVPPCLYSCLPISAGSQLTLFFQTGWAWLCIRPPSLTGSGELWIQATAHSFVTHKYNLFVRKTVVKIHRKSLNYTRSLCGQYIHLKQVDSVNISRSSQFY
jgi:hypothetical protein